jgi:hypothetical protein
MRLSRQQALAQAQPMKGSRGVRLAGETLNFVPADQDIRPLRHNVLLEPMDLVYSRYILVKRDTKPLRGRVLRVGPGHYPTVYLDHERHRLPDWNRKARRYSAAGTVFVPTVVKEGDVVELGGSEIEGYAFEVFSWGDRTVLWCTENDICGIVDE